MAEVVELLSAPRAVLAFGAVLAIASCQKTGDGSADAGKRPAVSVDAGRSPSGARDAGSPPQDAATPSPCGPCDPRYYTCCGAECVDLRNDQRNCGACGVACPPERPLCLWGSGCVPLTTCQRATACDGGRKCCDMECCDPDETCCAGFDFRAAGSNTLLCHPRAAGPCPKIQPPPPGPGSMCAAAGTRVATLTGTAKIEALAVGDLVYSVDRDALVAVPIVRISRTLAPPDHRMVRVVLSGGAVVEMSPGHPTADGRTFADLTAGAALGGVTVLSIERVPYDLGFTYDILPDSDTGTYVAGGVLIGSTLAR